LQIQGPATAEIIYVNTQLKPAEAAGWPKTSTGSLIGQVYKYCEDYVTMRKSGERSL
jgi:hypothetical protein